MKTKIINLMLLLLISISFFAQDIAISTLKILDTAGCNLAIAEVQGDNTYRLSNTSKVHNWFSGVFSGIDISSPTTFIVDMEDTGKYESTRASKLQGILSTTLPDFKDINLTFEYSSPGDVTKWEGLWPVYTYAKYWDYNSYIYYTKDKDGYWVSSDPFLIGDAKLAGNGKTPIQNVIADELADEFLSSDGAYWSAWAEIKNTRPNRDNTFQITKQFHSSDVSIAMKYPYTYDYEQEYMDRLENADISGVTVHKIGKSIRKHNLYVVEVHDPEATEEELKNRRVVLMYANEDGDEPDSSWVVDGAMSYLAQGLLHDDKQVKDILKDVTFLFIPLLDPVGWSNATYGNLTYEFNTDYSIIDSDLRVEIEKYVKFINNWIAYKNNNLDIVVNLHNMECAEGTNVLCPLIDNNRSGDISSLNRFILKQLNDVTISEDVWLRKFAENRLMSWCYKYWGAIQIPYEINSRYPENRLNQKSLTTLGVDFTKAFHSYFDSEEFERALPTTELLRSRQFAKRDNFMTNIHKFNTRNDYYAMIGFLNETKYY